MRSHQAFVAECKRTANYLGINPEQSTNLFEDMEGLHICCPIPHVLFYPSPRRKALASSSVDVFIYLLTAQACLHSKPSLGKHTYLLQTFSFPKHGLP